MSRCSSHAQYHKCAIPSSWQSWFVDCSESCRRVRVKTSSVEHYLLLASIASNYYGYLYMAHSSVHGSPAFLQIHQEVCLYECISVAPCLFNQLRVSVFMFVFRKNFLQPYSSWSILYSSKNVTPNALLCNKTQLLCYSNVACTIYVILV